MEAQFEHAEEFAEVLGIEMPSLSKQKCYDEDGKNMAVSNKHESMAVKHYTQALNRVPESRLKQIFSALAEVETAHLVLTNMYIFR